MGEDEEEDDDDDVLEELLLLEDILSFRLFIYLLNFYF